MKYIRIVDWYSHTEKITFITSYSKNSILKALPVSIIFCSASSREQSSSIATSSLVKYSVIPDDWEQENLKPTRMSSGENPFFDPER